MLRSHVNSFARREWRWTFVTSLVIVGTAACVRQPAGRRGVGTSTATASLHVEPEVVLVDVPARIWMSGLTPGQRAQLDALRALDDDAADEERYEELAAELPEEPGDVTVH